MSSRIIFPSLGGFIVFGIYLLFRIQGQYNQPKIPRFNSSLPNAVWWSTPVLMFEVNLLFVHPIMLTDVLPVREWIFQWRKITSSQKKN